jgi:hypothetical protein
MKRAGPGWLLLVLAGLAAVFGAFLPFYTYADGIDVTVWTRGLFPTAALIPLLGVAVGVEALFVLIRGHEPRSPFLNFTWEQVRLAVGAFMILLVLSYLLHDRAGGSLGIGYALLAASALATFGGGVLTRRAELARAPDEEAAAREHRPMLGPAIATLSRTSSNLAKNVADRSHTMRVRLAERREARAAARKEAAEKAAAERAAAEKAAAARAAAETAAAEKAAAENAAAEQAAAEKAAVEEPAEHPPPPAATVETLPTERPPAPKADEPGPPAETVESPVSDSAPVESEPEDTAELPLSEPAAANDDEDVEQDDKTVEQPRAPKLNAVPAEAETEATPTDGEQSSDGKDATVERAVAPEDSATQKESAESSSES